MPDGACFLNAGTVEALQVPQQYIAAQAEEQMKEITRRMEVYRGYNEEYDNKLEDKIVIRLMMELLQARLSMPPLNG